MKYIRTKDGISKLDDDWALFCKEHAGNNQADTIEELGDAYVIVPKDSKSKPYIVNTLSVFDDITDVLRHSDIYLSIWVDALLKPVAKMNDKGELELL